MYPLRIVGPSDSGKTTLVERLVPALSGRVATIKHLKTAVDIDEPGKDTYRHRAAGAGATYGLEDDGSWFATGADRELYDTLREIAPAYDYALVEGYSGEPTLPAIVLEGRDHRGAALATAPRGEAVDLNRVRARLQSQPELETPTSLVTKAIAASPAEATISATLSRQVIDEESTDTVSGITAGLTDRAGVDGVHVHPERYGHRSHIHTAVVGSDGGAVAEALSCMADRLEELDVADNGASPDTNEE